MMPDPAPDPLAALDGVIDAGRHRMAVRVYYEDTDFSDPPLL